MNETHSISSLAARVGITRTATLGAISSGRLPAQKVKAGAREIYTLTRDDIEKFKKAIVSKLEAKIARVTADPRNQEKLVGRALNNLRKEAEAENAIWSPRKLADVLGIGVEAATYVLNKYGQRVQDGFAVSPDAMRKIKAHIEQTRGGSIASFTGGSND